MIDVRRLYVNQLLNHYRAAEFSEQTVNSYEVRYRLPSDNSDRHLLFSHNAGLDFVSAYIKDLERKVDELQYVEKIIKAAKEI